MSANTTPWTETTEIVVQPGRCACGRPAAGYDALRDAPVCPVCARALTPHPDAGGGRDG